MDIGFNIELTGFEVREIEVLLAYDKPPEPESVPLPQTDRTPVSRKGDLWLIGSHHL